MTKKEAVRQLKEHGFAFAFTVVKQNQFEKIEFLLKLKSVSERDELLDSILKSYLRSHKLKLISND